MFRLNSSSGDRKPSRTGSKSGIQAITARLRPELRLAVDTDVSRHQGAVPEEVFPYETASQRRNTEQTATILSQRKRANATGLRRELENRDTTQAGLVRSDNVSGPVRPSYPGLPRDRMLIRPFDPHMFSTLATLSLRRYCTAASEDCDLRR